MAGQYGSWLANTCFECECIVTLESTHIRGTPTLTIQNNYKTPSIGYLRIPQILELIPIGRSTWWQWVADGKAPKPIKLGPRTTAWKAADIFQFIEDLEAEGRS